MPSGFASNLVGQASRLFEIAQPRRLCYERSPMWLFGALHLVEFPELIFHHQRGVIQSADDLDTRGFPALPRSGGDVKGLFLHADLASNDSFHAALVDPADHGSIAVKV